MILNSIPVRIWVFLMCPESPDLDGRGRVGGSKSREEGNWGPLTRVKPFNQAAKGLADQF